MKKDKELNEEKLDKVSGGGGLKLPLDPYKKANNSTKKYYCQGCHKDVVSKTVDGVLRCSECGKPLATSNTMWG